MVFFLSCLLKCLKDAKDLIENLLQIIPEKRLSIPEILQHKWLIGKNALLKNENYINKSECINIEQLPAIPGDINVVNFENLFYNPKCQKLPYSDYCSISHDFYTQQLDENAICTLEKFGYPRNILIKDLEKGELNHATAAYNMLVL